jgi:hypothetical protein
MFPTHKVRFGALEVLKVAVVCRQGRLSLLTFWTTVRRFVVSKSSRSPALLADCLTDSPYRGIVNLREMYKPTSPSQSCVVS